MIVLLEPLSHQSTDGSGSNREGMSPRQLTEHLPASCLLFVDRLVEALVAVVDADMQTAVAVSQPCRVVVMRWAGRGKEERRPCLIEVDLVALLVVLRRPPCLEYLAGRP